MGRIDINIWAHISAESGSPLLLGNGTSNGIHKEFAYPTLHSVANAKRLLSTTAPVFAKLRTIDFEHVLLAYWYAEIETLGEKMDEFINAQREATGFDLRYTGTMDPPEKDWRDCSEVLSRRDFTVLMTTAWTG